MYTKNDAAPVPPMGWNSYDYYNTAVTEADVRANARYMAEHLKEYGWRYVVVDIQWSDPNAGALIPDVQYVPFTQFCLDDWSRQIPAPNRFPSSAGGAGFKPLADYVHSLGLQFGIHIMRGIPRICAHNHTKILGADATADVIANPFSISKWNGDMYGVDFSRDAAAAQAYYDSIFALYAQWGVDFVKVDDICNTNMYPSQPYSAQKEIEAIAAAIEKCGRPMVFSLSPGPAVIEKAWHLEKYANMWRITDDFWDDWRLLRAMFERCEVWQKHVSAGSWPDCDMLPLGKLGKGFGAERTTHFTFDEQRTMMTLWCIFRSPLMLGADLPQLDADTLSLLQNREALSLVTNGRDAAQVRRDDKSCVWKSVLLHPQAQNAGGLLAAACKKKEAACDSPCTSALCVALFNLSDVPSLVSVRASELGLAEGYSYRVRDLWAQKDLPPLEAAADGGELSAHIPAHGAALFALERA